MRRSWQEECRYSQGMQKVHRPDWRKGSCQGGGEVSKEYASKITDARRVEMVSHKVIRSVSREHSQMQEDMDATPVPLTTGGVGLSVDNALEPF